MQLAVTRTHHTGVRIVRMSAFGGMNFDVFGVNVRLDYDENTPKDLVEAIEQAWDAAVAEDGPGDVSVSLSHDDHDSYLEQLSSNVTIAALSHSSGGPLMFHAAGIADEDGRVLAFVGPSGRGKTTLSRNLAKHYSYVSDETVVVEHNLTVRPYRKPLSLKRPQKPKEQVSPRKLKLKDLPDVQLKLAKLIVLDRREEAMEHPSISPVTLREAFELLVPETSYLTRMEKPLQRFAELCEAVGGVLRVSYSDASTLIELVPSLFAHEPVAVHWRPVMDCEHSKPPVGSEAHAEKSTGASEAGIKVDAQQALASRHYLLGRGEVYDAVEADDSLIVIGADSVLRVLAGVGPALWKLALEPISPEEMTAAIVAQFGEPPSQSAEELLRPILVELIESCVLRLQKRQTQTS